MTASILDPSHPAVGAFYDISSLDLVEKKWSDKSGSSYDIPIAGDPSIITDTAGEDYLVIGNALIERAIPEGDMALYGMHFVVYLDNVLSKTSTTQYLVDVRDQNPQGFLTIGDNTGYASDEVLMVGDGDSGSGYGRSYTKNNVNPGRRIITAAWSSLHGRWHIYLDGSLEPIYAGTSKGHADPVLNANTISLLRSAGGTAPFLHGASKVVLFKQELTTGDIAQLSAELYPYKVSGKILKDGSAHQGEVRAYNVGTGALINSTVTDASGNYEIFVAGQYPVYVMAVEPADYRPLMHGPVTPVARNP